jgi:hypothetical protein
MRLPHCCSLLLALLTIAGSALGQVVVKKGAVVYHGSASNTSAPAVIEESRVREVTREWKKMQAEGIDADSAQGRQLVAQMNNRIRDAVKEIAAAESRDMVTRKDDITDKHGKDVVDLTDKVASKLAE